jgi:hypothetical protein
VFIRPQKKRNRTRIFAETADKEGFSQSRKTTIQNCFSVSRRAAENAERDNNLVGFAHAMGINTVFYGFQDYRVAGIYFWDVPAVQAPVSVKT